LLESSQHVFVQRGTQLSVKGYELLMTHFRHKQIMHNHIKIQKDLTGIYWNLFW